MEIKQTLLMGKTGFEMKGNLAQKEPLILKKWQEDKVYEELLEKNKNSKDFMLHDGPPYANGDMHCGHMLNKILKDIILRQKAKNYLHNLSWEVIVIKIIKSSVNRFSHINLLL